MNILLLLSIALANFSPIFGQWPTAKGTETVSKTIIVMSQFEETANKFVGLEKRRPNFGRIVGQKYDRNCFFSPVQCMLSFREGSNFMDNFK
ncbi:hypothetical protein niasHS_001965 [Heterodera schachtii]|uniref:Uncharacterized protein n=1 Tax=Heterodera schachtii TaxID=97005 RepID=A0ABD2KBA2_HETSC